VDEVDHESNTQQEPDLLETLVCFNLLFRYCLLEYHQRTFVLKPENYVIHGVDVVAILKERQKLGNYESVSV